MAKYKCYKCKYEFAPRNKENKTVPKRCPYCGAEGSVKEKGHALQELSFI